MRADGWPLRAARIEEAERVADWSTICSRPDIADAVACLTLMQVKVIPDLTDSQIVQVTGMAEPGKSLGGQSDSRLWPLAASIDATVAFFSHQLIRHQIFAPVRLMISGPRDVVGASRHRAAALLPRRSSHHGQSVNRETSTSG